jgi:RNA polymerase sigma-70 factor (ECF subfamily)
MDETILALRAGNHKAFSTLFENYYHALCRYAFSILKDGDDAEDIVQKMFCKLWDLRSELEIRTSIKSYLYRIVHNECLNLIHQNTNRGEINREIIGFTGENVDDVNEIVAASDLQIAIDNALQNLAPKCRKVFEMSRNEQMSYSEIAKSLEISVNTVENHISNALKQLRVALKDYVGFVFLLLHI